MSVMFAIVGPSIDPEVITEMLHRKPTRRWHRGESRKYRIGGKTRILEGLHSSGGWKLVLKGMTSTKISSNLRKIIKLVEKHRRFLQRLPKDAELTISVFAGSPVAWQLSAEEFLMLGSCGIDLEVEVVYPSGEPQPQEIGGQTTEPNAPTPPPTTKAEE